MSPNFLEWDEPPFSRLMTHVYSDYTMLDPPCERDCDDCKQSCPECHIARYQGWQGGRPRYECVNIKRVYLQRNLAAHVAQTKHVLRKTVLNDLSEADSAKAASLGGGPGVECLALADSLEGTECRKLTFRSFDIEASWRAFFDDLTSTLGGSFKTLELGAKFVYRNIIEQGTKNQYDVVFVPWVLSELGTGTIPAFVEHAVNACRVGGHVVVLERKESNLGATVIAAFQASDSVTRVFDDEDEVQGHCGVSVPQGVCDKFKPKLNYQSLYYAFRRDS